MRLNTLYLNRCRKLCAVLSLCVAGCAVALSAYAGKAAEQGTDQAAENEAAGLLSGMIVYTSDFDKSINFYTEVLGLKVVGKVEKEGGLEEILLSTSGQFLDGMMLTLQSERQRSVKPESPASSFGMMIIMTPSNEAVAKRLRSAGYKVTEQDPLHLITEDPDGYQIMFYQLDPRMLQAQK